MSLFGKFYSTDDFGVQNHAEQVAFVLGQRLADLYPGLAFLVQPTNDCQPNEMECDNDENDDYNSSESAAQKLSIMLLVAKDMSVSRAFESDWRDEAERLCAQISGRCVECCGVRFDFTTLDVALNTFTIEEGWRRACMPCKDKRGNILKCFATHLHMAVAATTEQSYGELLRDWSADALHRFDVKHGLGGDFSVWNTLAEEHDAPPLGFACAADGGDSGGVWQPSRPIWLATEKNRLLRNEQQAANDRLFCPLEELDESDFCEFLKHCISSLDH